MILFNWLLVGHFVGDWMLQNDWMARNKHGRWWSLPCLVHCFVYTVIMLGALLFTGPYTYSQMLNFGLVIYISHWLIDGFDLARTWGRLINQTDRIFVRIVVDQTMHILILVYVAEYLL
ncbi:MAG: DUF3307 domain-containing protein [Caldilineaceae bacterium]|nr:DUF3307 domain-containing protein [Caldilineaceae bacterium]